MELTPAQREALTVALLDVRADVTSRITEYAALVWQHLGDWRDDDIARFVAAVAPRVEAGKLTIAQATDAYMAAMLGEPAGIVDLSQIRGGILPATTLRRPAATMRAELANGKAFADALTAGARRLESIITTDLQLAHTHQARRSMMAARGKVEAFRRVPTGRENCALCLIASTQRYWVEHLMPIHPGCDCGVAPLGKGEHPHVIDPDLLASVHDQVEALTGTSDRGGREVDYRKLIVEYQHGEYGPTIGWKHHKHSRIGSEADTAGAPPVPAAPVVPAAPKRSWVYDAIITDDLGEWTGEDLREMYSAALSEEDEMALELLGQELRRRERYESGYRGTGYTRAELRQQYAEYIDREYWQAEAEANGFLLNEAGRRAGIDSKSLFTGSEARAMKYASDELKWYWTTHPRLSFDAFVGDADARGRAGGVDF